MGGSNEENENEMKMKSLIRGYGREKRLGGIRWPKLCLHLSSVLIPPGSTTEMLYAFLVAF
jgi:hypothetical protein